MKEVVKREARPLGVTVPLVAREEEPVVVDPEVPLLEEEVVEEPVVVNPEVPLLVEEEIQGIRMIRIRIQSQI